MSVPVLSGDTDQALKQTYTFFPCAYGHSHARVAGLSLPVACLCGWPLSVSFASLFVPLSFLSTLTGLREGSCSWPQSGQGPEGTEGQSWSFPSLDQAVSRRSPYTQVRGFPVVGYCFTGQRCFSLLTLQSISITVYRCAALFTLHWFNYEKVRCICFTLPV